MRARRLAAGAWLALGLAACPPAATGPRRLGGTPLDPQKDPLLEMSDLERDLEATVLEGYSQLTLGNLDAYADLLADDVPLVLLRTGPRQVLIGPRPAEPGKYLRIEPCVSVFTKNLEVHLAADGSMGWTFDEVSCRVPDPFEGRMASIPLRITALYERDVDRWAMVMEHVSYALPVEDLMVAARADLLVSPAAIAAEAGTDAARRVQNLLEKLITGLRTYRSFHIARTDDALLLWPGPEHEFHAAAVGTAPTLEELFGDAATVVPQSLRVAVARNGRLAWVVGNLVVNTTVNDEPLAIGLRATYIFELRDVGWTQVQAHVSAPILQGELTKRVFGLELPDLSELPAP